MARLNALVRRSAGFIKPEIQAAKIIHLLKRAGERGEYVELTADEYELLEYLARHNRQVASKQRLLDVLYQSQEGAANTIEVMMSRLRKKLIQAGQENPIATIRGQGYLFEFPVA